MVPGVPPDLPGGKIFILFSRSFRLPNQYITGHNDHVLLAVSQSDGGLPIDCQSSRQLVSLVSLLFSDRWSADRDSVRQIPVNRY